MTSTTEKKWEDAIKDLIISLGFKDSITSENTGGFQVDATGGDQETYFEFDATVTRDPVQKYSLTASLRQRREKIQDSVSRHFPKKYKRFIWVVWIKGAVTPEMRSRATKSQTVLLNEEVYNSFRQKVKSLQKLTTKEQDVDVQKMLLRYRLMNILGAQLPDINAQEIASVPATKFYYGHGRHAYIFAMKPDTLVKSCFVLVREEVGSAGYQRLLDENRTKSIASFIERNKYSFPNNIIINFENEKIVEKKCTPSKEPGVYDCIIELPNTYCSAQVIDGQHRLFSFESVKSNKLKNDLKLDVLAFSNLSKIESARIFIDLNKEQKKIDPSLYWEIMGDYLSESPDGAIASVVSKLADKRAGAFRGKIKFPSLPDQDAEITLANICKGIKDRHLLFGIFELGFSASDAKKYSWNLFVRAKQKSNSATTLAVEQINQFFKAHDRHGFHKAWKSFVMTNTGINVMLRVMVEALKYNTLLGGKNQDLKKHFTRVLGAMDSYVRKQTESVIAERKKTSSEGARGTWAEEIIESIHKKIPLFARDQIMQKLIDIHLTKVSKLKNRTQTKRKSYMELIRVYTEVGEVKRAMRFAKKMLKDFNDKASVNTVNRLRERLKDSA